MPKKHKKEQARFSEPAPPEVRSYSITDFKFQAIQSLDSLAGDANPSVPDDPWVRRQLRRVILLLRPPKGPTAMRSTLPEIEGEIASLIGRLPIKSEMDSGRIVRAEPPSPAVFDLLVKDISTELQTLKPNDNHFRHLTLASFLYADAGCFYWTSGNHLKASSSFSLGALALAYAETIGSLSLKKSAARNKQADFIRVLATNWAKTEMAKKNAKAKHDLYYGPAYEWLKPMQHTLAIHPPVLPLTEI